MIASYKTDTKIITFLREMTDVHPSITFWNYLSNLVHVRHCFREKEKGNVIFNVSARSCWNCYWSLYQYFAKMYSVSKEQTVANWIMLLNIFVVSVVVLLVSLYVCFVLFSKYTAYWKREISNLFLSNIYLLLLTNMLSWNTFWYHHYLGKYKKIL